MKTKFYFLIFLLTFLNSVETVAQFPSFELKSAIETQSKNYIVYETAVWCKPCMDGLQDVIDSFKNEKDYKLIVWFDRYYLDDSPELMNKLKAKYGDSLFYFFPIRYYNTKFRLISINPQDKVLKKIMKDLNTTGKLKIDWPNMNWGKLFLINKKNVLMAKGLQKTEQINEIKNNINAYNILSN